MPPDSSTSISSVLLGCKRCWCWLRRGGRISAPHRDVSSPVIDNAGWLAWQTTMRSDWLLRGQRSGALCSVPEQSIPHRPNCPHTRFIWTARGFTSCQWVVETGCLRVTQTLHTKHTHTQISGIETDNIILLFFSYIVLHLTIADGKWWTSRFLMHLFFH